MSDIRVYETSKELVKDLKRNLKPYKELIKENTDRNQRFPFVSLQKIPRLDECVTDLTQNDYEFNESIDRKISKILRKYYRKKRKSIEEQNDVIEEQPPQKKIKVANSLLDLNLISDQNEDLDFEEVDESNKSNKINGHNISNKSGDSRLTNGTQKTNGFVHKSDFQKTNGSAYNSTINGLNANSNGFANNCSNSFKIPKKSSQSIETIISHTKSLSQRPFEAYNHLFRFLTDDQWHREDVMEQLLSIAKSMAANKDFITNVSKFHELMDKIKSLQYIDDEFWDDVIYNVDKKKSESKNTQQINSFLMSIHDFMVENKICVRVICSEAVIIAYRTQTNHPTAKDLMEMDF